MNKSFDNATSEKWQCADVIIKSGEFRVNETGKPLDVDALILYVNNEIQDPST